MSRNRSTTVKKYSKILKEDRDYDFEYMLDLEKFKLKRMSEYFSKSQIISDWERVVKEINLCIKLINIIKNKTSIRQTQISKRKNQNYYSIYTGRGIRNSFSCCFRRRASDNRRTDFEKWYFFTYNNFHNKTPFFNG